MTVELTLTSVYHQPYTSGSRNIPLKAIESNQFECDFLNYFCWFWRCLTMVIICLWVNLV